MIEQVALVWFKEGTTRDQIDGLQRAMAAIESPGKREYRFALDRGLQEGSAHAVVVATFDDEAAYRAYDANAEHDRVRQELARDIISRVERSHIES